MISSCGACAHYDGRYLHLLALGLEERDPEDIFSHQINFQCVVFCVTLLPCCVSCNCFSYDSSLIFCKNHH